jgi:RNA polymerase-interacting CarD/CdnL/TRCF family regulator
MAICADDWVVHPQHGVGRVVGLEERQFGAGPRQQYYQIAIHGGTVWVPVGGGPRGLRPLTPRGELPKYRGVLRSRPSPLADDHRDRQVHLLERLQTSTFRARCEVVRDLAGLRWHKPLSEGSLLLLRTTHHEVCAEWAAAAGLTLVEATDEVDALLLEGRKAHEA